MSTLFVYNQKIISHIYYDVITDLDRADSIHFNRYYTIYNELDDSEQLSTFTGRHHADVIRRSLMHKQ